MRFLRPVVLASTLLVAMSAAADAAAVDCGAAASTCVDSDALWFQPGATTFFSLASGMVITPKHLGFGLGTSLQSRPIVLRRSAAGPAGEATVPAIDTQINTSLLFSYGLTDKLQVDLVAPVTFYQSGSGVSTLNGPAVDVPSNGVRDMRIGAAYELLSMSRGGLLRGLGLVGRFDLSIPTGERDSFGGDRTVVAIPTVAAEYRIGPIAIGANLGARLRGTTTFLDRNVGSQGFLGLGVAGSLDKRETLALTGEVFALPSLVDNGTSPIQWLAGARWSRLWGGDLVLHGGAGGSFRGGSNAQLLEPAWRAVLDLRYAPIALDSDGDGIPDREDKCDDEREDRDGFEDKDGCPDPDNDKDGILDKDDRCPDEPEEVNGLEDTDGCPEPDKDFDGIKDVVDKCPEKPEDKNGYEDEDGCPEGGPPPAKLCADGKPLAKGETACDVDHDGVADELDVCPSVAEDKDGVADEDGCPEKDADEDGLGDQVDKCPLDAETINGVDDDDGCPEEGQKSLVTFEAGAIEVEGAIRFAPGSAVVTPKMKAQINMIMQRLQGLVDRGVEKIVVESWADTAGDNKANEALATKRAEAMAAAIVAAGVPEGLVKARPGDLGDPPAKGKPNYVVTVRTKRKAALTGKALTPAPAPAPAPAPESKPKP